MILYRVWNVSLGRYVRGTGRSGLSAKGVFQSKAAATAAMRRETKSLNHYQDMRLGDESYELHEFELTRVTS